MPRGKKNLAGLVEAGGMLAGMVPGMAPVAAASVPIAAILRGLGISRISKNATDSIKRRKSKRKKNRGSGRGGRGGRRANMAPITHLEQKRGVGVQVGARVPSTYQRTMAAPNRKDGVRLQACEGAQFVITTAAGESFATLLEELTPNNASLFEWLSEQAGLWTKFFFRKLRIHFVSTLATTTQVTIFQAYSPDVEMDTTPGFQDIMSMSQKNMAVGYQSFTLEVDLGEEGSEPYYIDTDGSDDRLESQGMVIFGQNGLLNTGGAPLASSFGEFFVEYEVDLYDRKSTGLTLAAKTAHAGLMNRRLPVELRERCGQAYVREVLKCRPPVGRKKTAEEKLVLRLAECGVKESPARQLAPSLPAATGF